MEADPYAPAEMAARAASVGVAKARLDTLSLFALAVLAGAFIALGAQLATVVGVDARLGFGPTRLLAGAAFSVGLILVVIAGAELFTGNTLLVMAWLAGRLTTGAVLRAWAIAYAGNFAGALATAWLVFLARQWTIDGAHVGAAAVATAAAKVSLTPLEAVVRGILANALVCLAVWLCFSARTNVDKILSIVGPIATFVAAGFEHSVANMYFVPIGLFLRTEPLVLAAGTTGTDALARLTWWNFVAVNLLPVTIGNVIGGAVLVGAVYWVIYLRRETAA